MGDGGLGANRGVARKSERRSRIRADRYCVTSTAASAALLDDLVVAARSGGGWAFGRIWELLAPKVRGYVLARGAHEPDDLTSEVFLQAFRSLSTFEGDGEAFKRWLFTIAHRRLVDDLRARARRGVDAAYDTEQDPRRTGSAEDAALDRLFPQHLRAMLDALTSDQREVLLLRVVGDLSIDEVAAVTGRNLAATKSLLRRASETLRDVHGRPAGAVPAAERGTTTAGAR